MNVEKSLCISVELDRVERHVTGFWMLALECIRDALEAAVRKDGDMRAYLAVGRGIGRSGRQGDLLFIFFLDGNPRGLSQKQGATIAKALERVGGWIEGVQAVPDEAVPVAMHADGVCMRVVVPGDDEDYVRWRLGMIGSRVGLVSEPYILDDDYDFPSIGEPDLPTAMLGGNASAQRRSRPATTSSLVVVFDLTAIRRQWGVLSWTALEEHLVRLLEATMSADSVMLLRPVIGESGTQLVIAFQYSRLSQDFAQALYATFADFESGPLCVGVVPTDDTTQPLLGAFEGRITAFADLDGGTPALRQVHIDDRGARWTRVEVPRQSPISFSLRAFRRRPGGAVTAEVERTVEIDLMVRR